MEPQCPRIFSVYKSQTTIEFKGGQTNIIGRAKRPKVRLSHYQGVGFVGKSLLTIASYTNGRSCVSLGMGEACQRGPIILSFNYVRLPCNNIRLLGIKAFFFDHAKGPCIAVHKISRGNVCFCSFCLGVPSCHIPGSYRLISPI